MKNILILLLLLLSLALQNIQAQQPITFERAYSDSGVVTGTRIRQTFDGGYIIAGYGSTPSVFFSANSSLMKTDSLGNVEWVKFFGNPSGDDTFDDVQQTSDSGYIACGVYPEMGMADNIYVVKTDKNGGTLWAKTWGSNKYDVSRSVKETYDGGYIVAGQWDTTGVILRLNSQGDTLWKKHLYDGSVSLFYIEQTPDSGFIAVGLLNTNIVNINFQNYVVRLDKYGNTVWEKNYGYSNDDIAQSVKILLDSNFIVGGYAWQFSNSYDGYLLKLNTNGDTLWTNLLSTVRENTILELAITDNGGIALGEMESTIANLYQSNILKIDSIGNLVWRREYGGVDAEYLFGITSCKDGGFAICGRSHSYGIIPVQYVVKTNENGLLTALVEIEDKKIVPIKVGPNPFEDILYIDLTELLEKDYQIVLYDMLGIELINKTVRGRETVLLPVTLPLPSAAYVLQVRDEKRILAAIQLVRK